MARKISKKDRMVLCPIYFSRDVDEKLRRIARVNRITVNEVISKIIDAKLTIWEINQKLYQDLKLDRIL